MIRKTGWGAGRSLVTAAALLVALQFGATAAFAQVDPATNASMQTITADVKPAGDPALKFVDSIDFGTAEQGKKIDIDFSVENKSDHLVKILDLKTGCGCTAKKESNPTEIKAGEVTSIGVEYNTAGKQGPQSRTITITTDDPGQEVYHASFKGNVVAPLFFSEQMINFGDLEEGKGASQEISLISTVKDGIKITKFGVDDERIKVEQTGEKDYEKDGAKGKEYTFKVSIPEDMPQASFVSRLSVETDKSDVYLPGIVVRGRVTGDIDFEPRRGAFAQVEGGEEVEKAVTLRSTSDTPFKILNVEIANSKDNDFPAEFKFDKSKSAASQDITVDMKGEGEVRTRQAQAVVTVQSDGKESSSRMTFPLTLVHRPAQNRVVPNMPQAPAPVKQPSGN